jgi:hypothetical protein
VSTLSQFSLFGAIPRDGKTWCIPGFRFHSQGEGAIAAEMPVAHDLGSFWAEIPT